MSGFRREIEEIGALLGYYAAYGDNSLPTFRDKLSVPYSRVKKTLEDGAIGFPETSVRNYRHTLRNISEKRRSQFQQQVSITLNFWHRSFTFKF
jgi:hypothetical protein